MVFKKLNRSSLKHRILFLQLCPVVVSTVQIFFHEMRGNPKKTLFQEKISTQRFAVNSMKIPGTIWRHFRPPFQKKLPNGWYSKINNQERLLLFSKKTIGELYFGHSECCSYISARYSYSKTIFSTGFRKSLEKNQTSWEKICAKDLL